MEKRNFTGELKTTDKLEEYETGQRYLVAIFKGEATGEISEIDELSLRQEQHLGTKRAINGGHNYHEEQKALGEMDAWRQTNGQPYDEDQALQDWRGICELYR